MKHRVRLHGKKPKEKSPRRVAKAAPKRLTESDVVKAVRHGAWPTVTAGLQTGIDPNHVFIHGDPLIMAVAALAPVKVVEAVLRANADPNAANRNGETALFAASDPKIVTALLQAGADPKRTARFGGTSLHVHAHAGHAQAMRALIDAGAEVDAVNDEGQTPLLLAIPQAHLPVVELLLARGANPNHGDRHGEMPLHKIVWHRSQAAQRMAEMLISAGANLESRSPENERTPLMLAATPEMARLLLDAGANVNAQTSEGLTALLRAVCDGEVAIARELLRAKADPTPRIGSKTAAEIAAQSRSKALRDLFR